MNQFSKLEQIKKSILDNFYNNQLHHGLLFLGNKGIGKFNLSFDLASQIILSSSCNKNDDLQKIQSNSHPDLLIIQKEEGKQSISIEITREINQYLHLSAAISNHRIIIIDAIDDLNKNSNNAILKTLEEPPHNVFLFLINHNSAKLLDTIKSRCKIIKIDNPNYQDFHITLQKQIEGISDEEVTILAKISDHSIGSALEMYSYNAIDLYYHIEQLILENNNKAIFELAKKISGNNELWNIFEKLVIFYFYNSITKLAEQNGSAFITLDKITNLFFTTKNLNLDKSQSIINIFNIIKNAKS